MLLTIRYCEGYGWHWGRPFQWAGLLLVGIPLAFVAVFLEGALRAVTHLPIPLALYSAERLVHPNGSLSFASLDGAACRIGFAGPIAFVLVRVVFMFTFSSRIPVTGRWLPLSR